MPINYLQLQQQLAQWVQGETERDAHILGALRRTLDCIRECKAGWSDLREQSLAMINPDEGLCWAIPVEDSPLMASKPLPIVSMPSGTLLAVDGSQAIASRQDPLRFALTNVVVMHWPLQAGLVPQVSTDTRLLSSGEAHFLRENQLALRRDRAERAAIVHAAQGANGQVLALLDGPILPFGDDEFDEPVQECLRRLHQLDVLLAGYIDRPGSADVVRLLRVVCHADNHGGLRDAHIFARILQPGARSVIFTTQIEPSNPLVVHFFYLHVGQAPVQQIARVEIPGWVAVQPQRVDELHALLVSQCREMAGIPYPYVLYRAHEEALVSYDEKRQVGSWLLQKRPGVGIGSSPKQCAKQLGFARRSAR